MKAEEDDDYKGLEPPGLGRPSTDDLPDDRVTAWLTVTGETLRLVPGGRDKKPQERLEDEKK